MMYGNYFRFIPRNTCQQEQIVSLKKERKENRQSPLSDWRKFTVDNFLKANFLQQMESRRKRRQEGRGPGKEKEGKKGKKKEGGKNRRREGWSDGRKKGKREKNSAQQRFNFTQHFSLLRSSIGHGYRIDMIPGF